MRAFLYTAMAHLRRSCLTACRALSALRSCLGLHSYSPFAQVKLFGLQGITRAAPSVAKERPICLEPLSAMVSTAECPFWTAPMFCNVAIVQSMLYGLQGL